MQQLNINEAITHFSQLIEKVSLGDSFIITKYGKPLAQLIPLDSQKISTFQFGTMQSMIKVSDDF